MKPVLTESLIMMLLISLCACAGGNGQNSPPASAPEPPAQAEAPAQQAVPPVEEQIDGNEPTGVSGEVVITFDYQKQSGSASNQFAVWIEDMDGKLVKTLYATRWTARGGYRTRPDSIALWAEKSGLASMEKSEADAISGATTKTGAQTYIWDLTDSGGNKVPPGEYRFVVEGTLRWKNFAVYSGVIEIGGSPAAAQGNAEFVYEASERYGALTAASPENNMIGPVTASFTPAV
jgi:hypothetical protein